jgi:hypothetical protein
LTIFTGRAGFAQARFADDQHKSALAVTRPLPALHQYADFLVPADKRREIAPPETAAATACANELEQARRFGPL